MTTATPRKMPVELSIEPPLPCAQAPRSAYHLTPQQVQFFDDHGYLILRQWITGDLLARVQQAGEAWISLGEALHDAEKQGRAVDQPELSQDFTFAQRENGEVMFRVNYLHNKGQQASLELLGSPEVLGVAESLCGPNFVPTYESMVFKQRGDGEQIPWHQDAAHPRRYRVFNFDLYLDASRVGAGALRVIPGSQKQIHDACAVREVHGWNAPGAVDVEMQPGDVLLHDVMILHGSEPTSGQALRRTVYLEFRSAEQILGEGPWDATWIEKRLRLVPVALAAYQAEFPNQPAFAWNISDTYRPAPLADVQTELKVAHEIHTPGSWCSAGDALPTVKGGQLSAPNGIVEAQQPPSA